MAMFKIEIKGYSITTSTQMQTIMYHTPLSVNIDNAGDGNIKLTALNADEAVDIAKKQIEIYRKP